MTAADQVVRQLLDYLESRIDLDHVAASAARQKAALNYEPVDRLPLVCYLPYEGAEFTPYPIPEAFYDPAKMMVNELLTGFTSIYHAVDFKDDAPYCLRPNVGVTIIASMLGASIRVLEESPPWVEPFEDSDAIREIIESPLPDFSCGLAPRVLEQYAYYRDVLDDYPACRQTFQLTLPDLQGPFDTAELLWGTGIFLAFYDEPELLTALLERITDVMLLAQRRFSQQTSESLGAGCQYQHGVGIKGAILLRCDTTLLIAPQQYREMVRPHDVRLGEELGSVAIHFCGDGSHVVDEMLAIPSLTCLDFGQSYMNDVDDIYQKAAGRQIALARVTLPDPPITAQQMSTQLPTGAVLVHHQPETIAEANHVLQTYLDG